LVRIEGIDGAKARTVDQLMKDKVQQEDGTATLILDSSGVVIASTFQEYECFLPSQIKLALPDHPRNLG